MVTSVNEQKLRKTIARKIKLAMSRALINQAGLARGTGLTPTAISLILSEKRTPDLVSLEAIGQTLGVTVSWLMDQKEKA